MEKIIDVLKQTREAKQISLKEVETATRIPLRYLQILEGGEESPLLPDKAYLVPFLRTYATFLGLEPTRAVSQFLTELQQETHVTELTPLEPLPQFPRLPTWAIPAFFFLVVVLVYTLMPQDEEDRSPSPPPAIEEEETGPPLSSATAHAPAIPAPTDSQMATLRPSSPTTSPRSALVIPPSPPEEPASPSSTSAAGQSQPLPVAEPHVLNIQAKEPAWVRVIIDGKQQKDVLLQPGEATEWSAKKDFLLTLGNAGGVAITLDGKVVPPFGQSGEVIRNQRLPMTPEATSTAHRLPSASP
jgi:cytoskeleton protein RodZ